MVQAVGSQVIVKLEHEKQAGSIIIPDNLQKENASFWGEVVAVGWDCILDVKPGDKIIFYRHEGFPINHEGIEYLSIQKKHILGVMT